MFLTPKRAARQANHQLRSRRSRTRRNQLRRRVHDFAARIHVIDTLDDTQKQRLLRLLIEDVRGELSGAFGERTFARFACAGTPGPMSPLDVGQGRRLLEVWHQNRSPQSRSVMTDNDAICDEYRYVNHRQDRSLARTEAKKGFSP